MGSETEALSMDSNQNSTSATEEYVIFDSSDESQEDSSAIDQSDLQVGILNEAFNNLKLVADGNKENGKQTVCGLLIGEIKLAQKFEKYQDKIFGYTYNHISHLNEPRKMASKAVIFMVISLNDNWKIPVGLFFVHNPDIKYFADTIEETLTRLDGVGVDIVSVTMNCVSPHLSFALAEELGAEIDLSKDPKTFKTFILHPSKPDAKIYILYDLDIILGLLKTYWANNGVFLYKNRAITYRFCGEVKEIKKIGFGKDADYDWIIIKKRINYDTETIGKTIADAIEYLKDLGHPDFQNTASTIQFIKVINLIGQLSQITGEEGEIFQNISETNELQWLPMIRNIIAYVKNLRSLNQDTPEHLSIFKSFTVGIVVYFTSLCEIYNCHVKSDNKTQWSSNYQCRLPNLLTTRFGLKHIRLGILEKLPNNMELTALGMFKKIKSAAEFLNVIDVDI